MVLVTGAAGHVGNALVRELVADGEKVRALVMPGEDITGIRDLPIEMVEGDVLDPASVEPGGGRGRGGLPPRRHHLSIMPGRNSIVRQVNVVGTTIVARQARLAGVRRLVYVSSIHALARPPRGTPIDETVPFDPHNAAGEYDRTKAEASLVILDEVRRGLDAVIVCPTGIIGPFDYRGSAMGRQIRNWMRPGTHVVFDGHFDFVDVRDVARGMILACRNGRRGRPISCRGSGSPSPSSSPASRRSRDPPPRSSACPAWVATLASVLFTAVARVLHKSFQFTTYALETLRSNSLISAAKARRELGFIRARSRRPSLTPCSGWRRTPVPQPSAARGRRSAAVPAAPERGSPWSQAPRAASERSSPAGWRPAGVPGLPGRAA